MVKSNSVKVKTGVPGLDKVFKDGIRVGSSVLLSGGPGTGKTIFTMHFLLEGLKNKEPCMYILYDTKNKFLDYADSLGLDLRKYYDNGLFTIIEQPVVGRQFAGLSAPLAMIKKKKIKRVVLDSLTMFAYVHTMQEKEYRQEIMSCINGMKDVTLLATTEAVEADFDSIRFKPEEFLFDGVIFLARVRDEAAFERVLHVSKMRAQEHMLNVVPFSIGAGGIKVYPDQMPFSLIEQENGNKDKFQ